MIKNIGSDNALIETLKSFEADQNKLIVLDFYADWCGPCKMIEPALKQFSNQYRSVSFLKVDVDECSEASKKYHISSIPSFVFLRGGQQVKLVKTNDKHVLQKEIDDLVGSVANTGASPSQTNHAALPISPIAGFMDLTPLLQMPSCECLNVESRNGLECVFAKDMTYLESDTDEQLIMYLTFVQTIKLHSLRISAPDDTGPKVIKLFINQINTPDFDFCEHGKATETVTLTPQDLKKGMIRLRYVKFQNVNHLTIFVLNNQNGGEKTRITNLTLYGNPVNTVDMSDFKRVAGKKGEAHG